MKRIFIFILILFISGFTYISFVIETAIIIEPESKLIIKGTTNINKFNCHFNTSELQKPIPVSFEIKNDKMVFKETELILKNDCFDCGNKNINKDFKSLLKTNSYPQIFIHLKEMQNFNLKDSTSKVLLDMEIAGIFKSYNFPVKIENNKNKLFVTGTLALNISDFNLEPPKKLLGILKVNNIIEIDFQLLFKELSSLKN